MWGSLSSLYTNRYSRVSLWHSRATTVALKLSLALLTITPITRGFGEVKVESTSAVREAQRWIKLISQSQDEPWFVCLRLRGSHLLYKQKLYGVQSRYGSWTGEWRRQRPNGYPSDEGVGLITDHELATLYVQLSRLAERAKLPQVTISKSPPCDLDYEEHGVQKHPQELMAELWLLKPQGPSDSAKWILWTITNPHINTDQSPQEMIELVKRQLRAIAEERVDVDLLLSSEQSGSLYLLVSQASEVWVDGVYRGRWPSVNPIRLSEGKYHLRVAPIDRRYASVSFEGLEVLAKTKTRFRVELELNEVEKQE